MSNVEDITKALRDRIQDHQPRAETTEVGHVVSIADGIARISGLDNCVSQEKLRFEDGTIGVALNLDKASAGAIILGSFEHITEGMWFDEQVRFCQFRLEMLCWDVRLMHC
jgi:F-type H+-transporting ATPase subunit alpha